MRLDLLEWPGFDWYDPRYALPVIPVGVTCLRMVYRGLYWSSSAGAPKRPLFLLVCCVRITGSSSSSSSKGCGASRARWVQPRARGCVQACQSALRAAGAGAEMAAWQEFVGERGLHGRRSAWLRAVWWDARGGWRWRGQATPRQPPGHGLRGRRHARVAGGGAGGEASRRSAAQCAWAWHANLLRQPYWLILKRDVEKSRIHPLS